MRNRIQIGAGVAACATFVAAQATIVRVEVLGHVEWNQFTSGTLAPVEPNDPAVLRFDLDSNVFTNSPNFPVRGYHVVLSSFDFQIGGIVVPLPDPLPPGTTPYFVLRNNDPGVDGFVFSRNVEQPVEVPVAIGVANYGLSYYQSFVNGTVLPSLDILDALGTWQYQGLSVYHFAIQRGDFSVPLGIIYDQISISLPLCPGDTNTDQVVDLADLSSLLAHFGLGAGATLADGDLDGDGDVDLTDLSVMLTNFGTNCA